MNITVSNVTDTKATVCGQEVTREYAEKIILATLIAQCVSHFAQAQVVRSFREAGLSTAAVPMAERHYVQEEAERRQQEARRKAEAERNAARIDTRTERQMAEEKADKEAKFQAIREHGERIRASTRSSNW
ncbi:hypothetical protein ACMSIO_08870 [Pseudomonas benzopyrenica]|uniref:hypothetical protein n=1 Tax=Pseudomonas benzopyrenica TaxID=2993566 RepID=UPI0039C4B781